MQLLLTWANYHYEIHYFGCFNNGLFVLPDPEFRGSWRKTSLTTHFLPAPIDFATAAVHGPAIVHHQIFSHVAFYPVPVVSRRIVLFFYCHCWPMFNHHCFLLFHTSHNHLLFQSEWLSHRTSCVFSKEYIFCLTGFCTVFFDRDWVPWVPNTMVRCNQSCTCPWLLGEIRDITVWICEYKFSYFVYIVFGAFSPLWNFHPLLVSDSGLLMEDHNCFKL